MKPKEIFWSGLKGGLFDEKHRKAMGEAIWLFGWLCMRQSQVNTDGEGLPHYGNPLTFAEIATDTGFPASVIRKWTARLTRTGYIHTRKVGNVGLIFFIHKAKSKAKNPKPKTRYFPAELLPNGNYGVRPKMDGPNEQVRPRMDATPSKDGRTYGDKAQGFQGVGENSNTLISTNLIHYNTAAVNPSAAISSLARKMERELQARTGQERSERLLLDQKQRILRAERPAIEKHQAAVAFEQLKQTLGLEQATA